MASDKGAGADFVNYGTPLEPLEEDEAPKKPVPLHEQTVRDEKGRYQRFHGAFTGGFSAGYFNTVGSKEGWTPSTFVSSRQQKAESRVQSRPEDFMDDEDFGEHGIAPKEITTTEDFASGQRDHIRDKARALTSMTAPIPGDMLLEELIAPARTSMGMELLKKMGWKEGQGIGPRVKRKPRKQKIDGGPKVYGCTGPQAGSEESEEEEDTYAPDDVTFAPKDIMPIDFTPKDNVHGLGYSGLKPQQALRASSREDHINLFALDSDRSRSLFGESKGKQRRRGGMSGQAFGVGALEDEDEDIYHRDTFSNYDTIIEEETGDGLYGWTAPQEYNSKKKVNNKDASYLGKILEGFTLAAKPPETKTIFTPPVLPRHYRPVHHFRPVLDPSTASPQVIQALQKSTGHKPQEVVEKGRHQLDASQRRDLLGESPLTGPASVFDLLGSKDKERLQAMRRSDSSVPASLTKEARAAVVAAGVAAATARASAQSALAGCVQPSVASQVLSAWSSPTADTSRTFRPFEKNSDKQARYDLYISKLKQGDKDALESSLDQGMTEWERDRERDEFVRAAVLYKPSSSLLSSRFTRGKNEDDNDKVEVQRDQENDVDDKQAAVMLKMFGKLTRDTFEWHPDKVLCKRFNVPDPYPRSALVGLPKVKRDKFSVFNFLTLTESNQPSVQHTTATALPASTKPAEASKRSRWDVSAPAGKPQDVVSEFLSTARTEAAEQKRSQIRQPDPAPTPPPEAPKQSKTEQQQKKKEKEEEGDSDDDDDDDDDSDDDDDEEEEKRPPMDLFKAIFASSDDEKSSSSSEDESEEEEKVGAPEQGETSKPSVSPAAPAGSLPTIPATETTETKPPIEGPAPASATSVQHRSEEEEEFGPKLPPSSIWGPPSTAASASSSDYKKKSKEKHKARKDHKHKKEKKHKKKHKKHKGKDKKRKKSKKQEDASGSSQDSGGESSDNMDSESEVVSTEELLKRLKGLRGK